MYMYFSSIIVFTEIYDMSYSHPSHQHSIRRYQQVENEPELYRDDNGFINNINRVHMFNRS